MKRFLLFFVIVAFAASAIAKPVDNATARKVASSFLQSVTGKTYTTLEDVTSQTPYHEFYCFSLGNDGGFVLVAADDCVVPILGYSESSAFVTRDMPAHVAEWMEKYEEQVAFYRSHYGELPYGGSEELRNQWESLRDGGRIEPQYSAVSPLMTTTWGQSPLYNNLCPMDSTADERTVTGCTATATAQIMKFWGHPTTGVGSHSYTHPSYGVQSANFGTTTYNWSNMPNALTASSSAGEINAVATLMYHVGVAVQMNYGISSTGGSGAQTYSAGNYYTHSSESALAAYFKYKPSLHAIHYGDFSHEQWCSTLRSELTAGRPILYTGYDPGGGHAFVLDGFDNQGLFHVNWGWNGSYNGHYAIGDLHPGTGGVGGNLTYTFNLQNAAVVGIEPLTTWNTSSTTTLTLGISNSQYGSVDQTSATGSYGFGDTMYFWAQANPGCRFYKWNDGCTDNPRQMIARGGTVNMTATVGPLSGDTLSYCTSGGWGAWGTMEYDEDWYWGIRLPAGVLPSGQSLTAVEMFAFEQGAYEVRLYSGSTASSENTPVPETLLGTQTFNVSSAMQWNTLALTTPQTVDNTQDLWIVLHNYGSPYPAALSTGWGGNVDAAYMGSTLTDFYQFEGYSVMVRGLFGDLVSEDCTVTLPFEEGFESGLLSDCWTVDGPAEWEVGTGDYDAAWGAHSGNYNVVITHTSRGAVTKLISPTFDFTGVTEAELRFWHLQREWAGDQDTLRVYYRKSPAGAWNRMATYGDNITTWTEEVIALTDLSSTFQLAFEMTDQWGYGIAIDDITVTLPYSCSPVTDLYVSNVTSSSVTLSWTDNMNSGATYSVYEVNPTGATLLASGIVGTTYSVTNLEPETNYLFGVVADCSESDNSSMVVVDATTEGSGTQEFVVLSITVNDPSMGTTNPEPGVYRYGVGETIQLTALPFEGYQYASTSLSLYFMGIMLFDTVVTDDLSSFVFEVTNDMLGAEVHACVNFSKANADINSQLSTLNSQLIIYPNPTSGELFVDCRETEITNAELLDINGRIIASFGNANRLDLSSLTLGSYLLRIVTADGVTVKRIVKK